MGRRGKLTHRGTDLENQERGSDIYNPSIRAKERVVSGLCVSVWSMHSWGNRRTEIREAVRGRYPSRRERRKAGPGTHCRLRPVDEFARAAIENTTDWAS